MSFTGKTQALLFLQTLPVEIRKRQRAASAELYQVHTPGLACTWLQSGATKNLTELASNHLLNSPNQLTQCLARKRPIQPCTELCSSIQQILTWASIKAQASFDHMLLLCLRSPQCQSLTSLRTEVQEGPDNSCVTPHPLLIHTDVTRPCSSIANGLSLCECKNLSHHTPIWTESLHMGLFSFLT